MGVDPKPRPAEPRRESPSSERPAGSTSLSTCNGLRLRHARPEDAPLAARLLYATLGPMADYLLGTDDATQAQDILRSSPEMPIGSATSSPPWPKGQEGSVVS